MPRKAGDATPRKGAPEARERNAARRAEGKAPLGRPPRERSGVAKDDPDYADFHPPRHPGEGDYE